MKCYRVNRPVLEVSPDMLRQYHISDEQVRQFIPDYIRYLVSLEYGWGQRLLFLSVRVFLSSLVWVFLRPRRNAVGFLDQQEVDEVYNHEANYYDWKHHMTTRYKDTIWRRIAGWFVATLARKNSKLRVLDLCTGTGLTVEGIQSVLMQWGLTAEVTGLDYNQRMLDRANARNLPGVQFVRGDATRLTSGFQEKIGDEFEQFERNSFDVVTQMCGIGGIPEPLDVFECVLRLLKPGGRFWMHDMHKPIPSLPGILPLLPKWLQSPALECYIYEEVCLPLVLKRLWGWRDPTALFYLLPMVSYSDSNPKTNEKEYWGFEVENFMVEPQRWWFGIPYMPVAQIIVKKVAISKEEAELRESLLICCSQLPR